MFGDQRQLQEDTSPKNEQMDTPEFRDPFFEGNFRIIWTKHQFLGVFLQYQKFQVPKMEVV